MLRQLTMHACYPCPLPPLLSFPSCQITNLCGGFLATRYSAKGVLALGVVLWSMFTIATPAAAAAGDVGTLIVARWVLGGGGRFVGCCASVCCVFGLLWSLPACLAVLCGPGVSHV